MNAALICTNHVWRPYLRHHEHVLEKERRISLLKQTNDSPYFPSAFVGIDEEFALRQVTSAIPKLLRKSVYILHGETPVSSIFGGLVFVDYIEHTTGPSPCFSLHGSLMSESGEIYDNLRVRVAILEKTLILYRDQ